MFSAATLPSWVALWASIGCPTTSPMAKMWPTLVRCCLSTGMNPRSSTNTPAASAPTARPLGRRPTATSTLSNTALSGAFALSLLAAESKVTVSPSGPALMPVTFVPSQIASYDLLIRLVRGVTMSLSAPGMSWSISSTTEILVPSSE